LSLIKLNIRIKTLLFDFIKASTYYNPNNLYSTTLVCINDLINIGKVISKALQDSNNIDKICRDCNIDKYFNYVLPSFYKIYNENKKEYYRYKRILGKVLTFYNLVSNINSC